MVPDEPGGKFEYRPEMVRYVPESAWQKWRRERKDRRPWRGPRRGGIRYATRHLRWPRFYTAVRAVKAGCARLWSLVSPREEYDLD